MFILKLVDLEINNLLFTSFAWSRFQLPVTSHPSSRIPLNSPLPVYNTFTNLHLISRRGSRDRSRNRSAKITRPVQGPQDLYAREEMTTRGRGGEGDKNAGGPSGLPVGSGATVDDDDVRQRSATTTATTAKGVSHDTHTWWGRLRPLLRQN